jgi:hypothetical protein
MKRMTLGSRHSEKAKAMKNGHALIHKCEGPRVSGATALGLRAALLALISAKLALPTGADIHEL